jgi:cell division protein FtsL
MDMSSTRSVLVSCTIALALSMAVMVTAACSLASAHHARIIATDTDNMFVRNALASDNICLTRSPHGLCMR